MNFTAGINAAYTSRWSFINTFKAQFLFSKVIASKVGWGSVSDDDFNLSIKNFTTPRFVNTPIEVYVGDQWRVHNGRSEMYRFTVTFRDKNQLELYRKFVDTYNWQRTMYFDDIKMSIKLYKDADYTNEKDQLLFDFEGVMIEAVSSLSFSNETESQIAEFDVEFKCTTPRLITVV